MTTIAADRMNGDPTPSRCSATPLAIDPTPPARKTPRLPRAMAFVAPAAPTRSNEYVCVAVPRSVSTTPRARLRTSSWVTASVPVAATTAAHRSGTVVARLTRIRVTRRSCRSTRPPSGMPRKRAGSSRTANVAPTTRIELVAASAIQPIATWVADQANPDAAPLSHNAG